MAFMTIGNYDIVRY